MDEPFFLALARQILAAPLDPLGFDFNWYGRAVPMASINNTPPLFPYLLAFALKLSGGGEWSARALFWPFDLAAAWGLLALAARFLKKPLLPVLAVVLGPAWLINLNHLMPERVMAGLLFPALWLLCAGVEEKNARAYRGAAVLAALALLTKVNAVFVVVPALVWAWSRGVPVRRAAAWGALALSGLALGAAWSAWAGGGAGAAVWSVTSEARGLLVSAPSHSARAVLAFAGGLAPWTLFAAAALAPSRRLILGGCAVAAALYAPWLDLAPLVLPVDRLTGFVFGSAALVLVLGLATGPRTPGRALWASWLGAALALQLAYWTVLARFVLFLLPPLALWTAERLEADWAPERARGLWLGGVAFTALIAVACAAADWSHAGASRAAAAELAAPALGDGRRVWFTGHWGLQEYMTAAGARPLDASRGGWDEVKKGDLVIVPLANTNVLRPQTRLRAEESFYEIGSRSPVRPLSATRGEGGFYSSTTGFLPWSLSNEPVERITVVSPD